jgi:hypothetical protein
MTCGWRFKGVDVRVGIAVGLDTGNGVDVFAIPGLDCVGISGVDGIVQAGRLMKHRISIPCITWLEVPAGILTFIFW